VETREIDERLRRYTAAEHRIGANLQELEQHSVYQLLRTGVLTGKTAAALGKATTDDAGLWELFSLLGSALDRVRLLRGTGNRIGGDDRRAIAELLNTKSIVLDTHEIPLGERSLTTAATHDQRISIEALIARMSSLYEPIRDVVTHSETVLRGVLPRLNSAETTVTRLRKEAGALGLSTIELDRIDETIARVRDLSLTDPLAIPADVRSSFDQAIHDVAATIAAERSSHDELAHDIAAASDLLDACRELIAQANRGREEALAKVAQPRGLRQAPSIDALDGDRGLASRLEPVLASQEPWQVVRRRLDEWSKSATRFRDQLAGVAAANAQPIEKRNELRGRLAAFRAKMAATGYSEDLVLRDLSAEAHNELFTSPTDLIRAERLVTEFGKRLAST